MKTSFLAVTLLLALFAWSTQEVNAQTYDPAYDSPYSDGIQQYQQYPEQYDPYYELHAMHYQLHRQPYQSYQLYQPCCYAEGDAIPQWSRPISPQPQSVRPPQAQVVSPLPPAGRR
jgi:hypothetical protein